MMFTTLRMSKHLTLVYQRRIVKYDVQELLREV